MKKAFTLIELIFVIVIIGIIAGIGFSSLKTDYANKDGEFILLKIKEARYKAIGYEGQKNNTCIVLTKNAINSIEQNDPKNKNPYKIRSSVNATLEDGTSIANDILCFDSFGRPHEGNSYNGDDIKLDNIMHQLLNIDVKNRDDTCSIRVHPISGYAIIICR